MEFTHVESPSAEISDNKVLTFCKFLLNANILFLCPFLPLIDPLLVQQALKRSFRSKHIHLVKRKIQNSQLLIILLTSLMNYEKHSLISKYSQHNHTSFLHKHQYKADATLSWEQKQRNRTLSAKSFDLTKAIFSIPARQCHSNMKNCNFTSVLYFH